LGQADYTKNLFFDTCVLDIPVLEASIKQKGVGNTLFGTEAPGSGGAVRPETGKTSDDLVPIISSFNWLTEDDKLAIFNKNPLRFCTAFK
ncbi:MAG: amidohydrolase, partial [Dehalococcoidia bacterium]|nr:amidohydrolase [Dehalococcoidia bacterium]